MLPFEIMTEETSKIGRKMFGKDIVSIGQYDKKSILSLFSQTSKIKKTPRKYQSALKGKLAALLFWEPSSRTFSSFSAAIKRLGGGTIEYQNPMQNSSAVKGETLEDTAQVFSNYVDIIIMRHFLAGSVKKVADAAAVPVINAGDGIGEHPTQALLDMFTIFENFKTLDGMRGLIVGDLLNGRTVHSLIAGLSLFKNTELYLLAPKTLKIQPELREKYLANGVKLIEISKIGEIPSGCHFWYWTRVQKERFKSVSDYEKVRDQFLLTKKILDEKAGKKTLIMHPLPRVNEIEYEIDSDPRAIYLTKQVKNGMYVRMALLLGILGKK